MGSPGWCPPEYSSGETTRPGRVSKAGNTLLRTELIESALPYRARAIVGAGLCSRQTGVSAETLVAPGPEAANPPPILPNDRASV
jgi:hypothetical protein